MFKSLEVPKIIYFIALIKYIYHTIKFNFHTPKLKYKNISYFFLFKHIIQLKRAFWALIPLNYISLLIMTIFSFCFHHFIISIFI